MTKPELVTLISQKADITKKAATKALSTFVSAVHASLKKRNGKIRVSDLGTFRVIEVKARRGVNPRTGRAMTIPAMRLPRFSAAKSLKQSARGHK